MNFDLFKDLHKEGLITPDSFEKIKHKQANPLFSLHWELKTILYLGVMLLSTGMGILIYQNIDTIGHQVILMIIAAISAGCFFYCFKQRLPFSWDKVKSPGSLFDYILLLGALSFLTFIGYIQYQYTIFGTNYGLATFIPMVVLFLLTYRFDHLGLLSLAITNLALWMGISVTAKQLLLGGDFNSSSIVLTALLLGFLLLISAFLSNYYNLKKHFRFTYMHFGVHVAFIALLSAYFVESVPHLLILGVFVLGYYVYQNAMKQHSFYFLLLAVLYSYIALSILAMEAVIYSGGNVGSLFLGFLYFIGSSIGIIILLIRLNKKIKAA